MHLLLNLKCAFEFLFYLILAELNIRPLSPFWNYIYVFHFYSMLSAPIWVLEMEREANQVLLLPSSRIWSGPTKRRSTGALAIEGEE